MQTAPEARDTRRVARAAREWKRIAKGAAGGAEREDKAMRLKLVMKDREYRDALAEQVALELGERLEEPILLLDLTYFYREGQPEESVNTFRKLVYYLQSEKNIPVEVFFRRETGNMFRIRMPRGMNELMRIPGAECLELIREMGRYFSAVVCSVGDCFSERNIEVMKNSEWCIYMAEEDMREYFPKTSLVVPERAGEIRNAARLVQGILDTP